MSEVTTSERSKVKNWEQVEKVWRESEIAQVECEANPHKEFTVMVKVRHNHDDQDDYAVGFWGTYDKDATHQADAFGKAWLQAVLNLPAVKTILGG